MNALQHELESGAARLRGTTLQATIRINESDLNDLVAAASPTGGVKLEVRSENRVTARFGMVHATFILPRLSDLSRSPEFTVALASSAVAWALKHVLKQPYLRIRGRHVIVDLSAVPALRSYHELLRSITRLEIVTHTATVTAHVSAAVS